VKRQVPRVGERNSIVCGIGAGLASVNSGSRLESWLSGNRSRRDFCCLTERRINETYLRLQDFITAWQAVGTDVLCGLQVGSIGGVLILPTVGTPSAADHGSARSNHVVCHSKARR